MNVRAAASTGGRVVFALLFIGGGINHFRNTPFYEPMMPDYLPWHLPLIYISGVCELALGCLLLVPATRRLAAWGLFALLLAVFPANLNMTLHPEVFPDLSQTLLWLRLPLQGVLLAWAYAYTRRPRAAA